jgi:ferrous iron transport protein A
VLSLIPLQLLGPGDTGRIASLYGDDREVLRLQELGLCQGAIVGMVRTGSPCIIKLGEQTLCLRTDGALQVLVEPDSP